jgi:cephalosporin hydroxylase
MLEGDSTAADIAKQVAERAKGKECVLVCLDSNHTHEHVLQEMELYGPLVTPGSYMVVLDTVIEDLPDDFYDNRPWSRGNNPRTAVRQYLESNDHFTVDQSVDDKLLISVAPGGYIKRVK